MAPASATAKTCKRSRAVLQGCDLGIPRPARDNMGMKTNDTTYTARNAARAAELEAAEELTASEMIEARMRAVVAGMTAEELDEELRAEARAERVR